MMEVEDRVKDGMRYRVVVRIYEKDASRRQREKIE